MSSKKKVPAFSEIHWDWYDQIQQWRTPFHKPREWRRCFVSPRSSSKTTTWFLIAPLWAACYGIARFVAAFADSGQQAEMHLRTFKRQLETNKVLRYDFPELCMPAVGERSQVVSNNRNMIIQANGFVFAAKGSDSSSLGMKVDERRPDVIILDDIEPDATGYSAYQAEGRLDTLLNSILSLNEFAKVVWSGTVTMAGSLIHQLVRTVQLPGEDPAPWIEPAGFSVAYYPAIYLDDNGDECSIWPEKWDLETFLLPIRHTHDFALNFMNSPVSDGSMWSEDDIVYDALLRYPRTIISVDPAVTKKKTSDFTGIAVLSHHPKMKRTFVREVWKVKLSPKELRAKLAAVLAAYPEAAVLLVETNQGGDTWADALGDLGIKYREVKQTVKKEDRALTLLNGYQKREIVHARQLPALDTELLAFPNGLNDDLVDAVGSGFTYLTGAGLPKAPKSAGRPRQLSYA